MNEPTKSTEEAMQLLHKYRKELIAKGRAIARIVCREEGTVHARRIYDEMKHDPQTAEVGWRWLGALFYKKEFEWTGEWHTVKSDIPTNTHGGRGIRIWRLKDASEAQ